MAACPAYFLTLQTIGNVYIFPVHIASYSLQNVIAQPRCCNKIPFTTRGVSQETFVNYRVAGFVCEVLKL